MHPDIKIGNSFITPTGVIYKILDYTTAKLKTMVHLDCVGRTYWMKRVTVETINEWITSGRLTKIET